MKQLKRLSIAMIVIVLAMMAIGFAGCGSNDAAAPAVMTVLPIWEGMIPHGAAGPPFNSFTGPVGKYRFSVLPAMDSPSLPPPDARYSVNVGQVASADYVYPNTWIRTIVPDSAGLYDLSPPGFYYAVAYQTGEFDAVKVAECRIQTGNFPPPTEN